MDYPKVILKPKEEGRLQSGHLWAFSNEVAQAPTDLPPGSLADLFPAGAGSPHGRRPGPPGVWRAGSPHGRRPGPPGVWRAGSPHGRRPGPPGVWRAGFLGRGFYHPHSLIAFRVLSSLPEEIGETFFQKRLNDALAYRSWLYPNSKAYRWVFGESDRLPGLVIDRYGEYLAVQVLAAGMERLKDLLIGLLAKLVSPKGIVWRSDSPVRALEGLPEEAPSVVYGEVPARVEISLENGTYFVDLLAGQKTGYYFDQRDNRQALAPLCSGKKVLDAYCYSGGFGIAAARSGAREVVFIDSSRAAIELAEANAQLNGLSGCCTFVEGDALQLLSHKTPGGAYDVVVVDPPSYARSKKHLPVALKAYEKLNALALKALPRGGLLATTSCSHAVTRELFLQMLRRAANKARRSLRLLEVRSQAKDHPVLLAMPETEYLKFALCQVQ